MRLVPACETHGCAHQMRMQPSLTLVPSKDAPGGAAAAGTPAVQARACSWCQLDITTFLPVFPQRDFRIKPTHNHAVGRYPDRFDSRSCFLTDDPCLGRVKASRCCTIRFCVGLGGACFPEGDGHTSVTLGYPVTSRPSRYAEGSAA